MSSNTAGRITAIIAHQGDVPINRLNSVTESLMQVFDERIAELEAELEQCLNCCKRVGELEAHNQQLLADKEASPAIIAGYRERGEQLLARIAELEAERDAAYNKGMERSVEILNSSSHREEAEYRIRKEIEK